MKKRILSLALALCLVICAVVPSLAAEPDGVLRFDENGEFKILHLSDCQDGYPARWEMFTYFNYMIDEYDPDLVVFGGDNCVCEGEHKQAAIAELVKPFVDKGVYFTLVFGNHDHQQGVDNDTQLKYYQEAGGKYCLAYDADPNLSGTATHNLPVYGQDGKLKFNVWLFDSGNYVKDENGKDTSDYSCVQPDQIEWYKETYKELEKEAGGTVYSVAFQHIPVLESFDALFATVPFDLPPLTETYSDGNHYAAFFPKTNAFKGHLMEPTSPGYHNYGQLQAMKDTGDVLAILWGHDHINSYEAEYNGIDLINTPTCSFESYGNDIIRGGRLITIYEDDPVNYDNEVITVNELALQNSDFAKELGISPVTAIFWIIIDALLLFLKNVSALVACAMLL